MASSLPVENLSLGGAFLRTLMPLQRGTAIGLQLFCPGRTQPLAVAGKIVSVGRSEMSPSHGSAGVGVGVAFDPLTPDQAQWLRRLLLAHAPGPGLLEGDARLNAAAGGPPGSPVPQGFLDGAPRARQAPELVPEVGKLMVQVKGLLMQISDWQSKADGLEKQNRALQAENEQLKAAVAALSGGRVA